MLESSFGALILKLGNSNYSRSWIDTVYFGTWLWGTVRVKERRDRTNSCKIQLLHTKLHGVISHTTLFNINNIRRNMRHTYSKIKQFKFGFRRCSVCIFCGSQKKKTGVNSLYLIDICNWVCLLRGSSTVFTYNSGLVENRGDRNELSGRSVSDLWWAKLRWGWFTSPVRALISPCLYHPNTTSYRKTNCIKSAQIIIIIKKNKDPVQQNLFSLK